MQHRKFPHSYHPQRNVVTVRQVPHVQDVAVKCMTRPPVGLVTITNYNSWKELLELQIIGYIGH